MIIYVQELYIYVDDMNEQVAARCNDPHTTQFIESEFLEEQVKPFFSFFNYIWLISDNALCSPPYFLNFLFIDAQEFL